MKRKFYFIAAIFLAAFTAESFAQLTKIWDVDKPNWGGPVSFVSNKGKVANVNGYGLVDLNNGHVTFSKNNTDIGLTLNHSGTRYFLGNWDKKELIVYDIKTNEAIDSLHYREYLEFIGPDDSTMIEFDAAQLTLKFWNIYTNKILDTFRIPLDIESYSLSTGTTLSYNSRYVAFHIQKNFNAVNNNFGILDRETKELIFTKVLPTDKGFGFFFLNHSNIMVYQTEIQLPGDDKKYSYLRMYDLDKRTEVRDIKFPEITTYITVVSKSTDDRYLIYTHGGVGNFYLYDIVNDKRVNLQLPDGLVYLDDTLYVSAYLKGYKIDWTVGVEDTNTIGEDLIIYPNPSTNTVNLNIDEKYFNGQWQITDLSGRIILNGMILSEPQLQINIGHFPAQTYYLQLTKGSFTVTYPLIKN